MNDAPRSYCPHKATDLVHWHDPKIWGGSVPTGGDVILPANKKVLVSSCSWPATGYKKITVPAGSELIINDAPMTLTFRNLLVNGAFRIGSPTCRVFSNIQIHFQGGKVSTSTDEIGPFMGAKGIGVSSTGLIDIHGKQYHPTWTRLVHSAKAGDTIIYLDDSVNWEVNQEIVITTTTRTDLEEHTSKVRKPPLPPHQNEVRKIAAISGKKIQLSAPLSYDHYAGPEYQAEVGLLSRRIQFFGNTNDADRFGGHILVSGIGRFSGIELKQMGQLNRMARYPLHFHMGKSQPYNFITDCSIVDSNFRCITIHATNDTTVSRNVAYNALGSCIYLEDGVEENNEISFNLIAHTKTIGVAATGTFQGGEQFDSTGEAIQPSDHAAAGIYITNAMNKIYGNAVSGGWAAYSFPNMFAPTGLSGKLSAYSKFNPSEKTNLEFSHNSAHSAGHLWGSGSCMYVGGKIWEDAGITKYISGRTNTRDPHINGLKTWNYWENNRVFLCNRGINHWGDRLIVKGYECYDSSRCAVLFGESAIDNAIFNGGSGNVAEHLTSADGFQFYDTRARTILTNIKCVNYNRNNAYCLRALTSYDVFKPEGIAATKAFTFINTPNDHKLNPKVVDLSSSRFLNIFDADGSFIGKTSPQILGSSTLSPTQPSQWWNYKSSCQLHDEIKMYSCPKSSLREEVIHIFALSPGLIDDTRRTGVANESNSVSIGSVYLFGVDNTERWTRITKNPGITGVSGIGGWYWDFDAEPSQLTFRPVQIPEGRSITVAVRYPLGTTFTITQSSATFTPAISLADLMTSTGTKYFVNPNTGHLFLKLVSISNDYFSYSGVVLNALSNWPNYDITIHANCPKQSCSTPKLIPAFSASAVVSTIEKIPSTSDSTIPRPPKKSDPFEPVTPAPVAAALSTSLPTVPSITSVTYPAHTALTGTFTTVVSYIVKSPSIISVVLSNDNQWLERCSRFVEAGAATVRVVCSVKNNPTSTTNGLEVYVQDQTHAQIASYPKSPLISTPAFTGTITDDFSVPFIPAASNTLSYVHGSPFPSAIPVKGLVAVRVSYSTTVKAHLILDVQESDSWQSFGENVVPVPPGSGTITLGALVTGAFVPTTDNTILFLKVSMKATSCYLATEKSMDCADLSPPLAKRVGILSDGTIAHTESDETIDPKTVVTTTNIPSWAAALIVVAVIVVFIVVGAFVVHRLTRSDRVLYLS